VSPLPFVPASAEDHARLGDWYRDARRFVEAQAQYRTALTLGLEDPGIWLELASVYLALGRSDQAAHWCARLQTEAPQHKPAGRDVLAARAAATTPAPLETLDHNRYFRMRTLATALDRTSVGVASRLSVLDIGGGDGMLALFLPEMDYALAEPGTNGIAAQALPFGPRSFDVVLACHVLEHIPAESRVAFLETLCRLARRQVVLLNPFRPAASGGGDAWLELVLAVTGAPWAREHLACGFPALEDVLAFAAARGMPCRAEPNGTRTVSTLHVLLSHYAAMAQRSGDLPRINGLLNTIPPEVLHNEDLPTAWLVTLAYGAVA